MRSTRGLITICGFWLFLTQSCFAAEYNVAVRAHHGIDAALKQWGPTIDAINEKLDTNSLGLLPIVSLTEISVQAKQNQFDFILTNPSSFVELNLLYDAKALATLNNKRANTSQTRFGSVIFVHAENDEIRNLQDLSGKRLMAVSEPAFGGWRVAWFEMLKQKFDPHSKLKSITFSKSKTQNEVVHAVLNRNVDAGVVRTDMLERLEAANIIDMRYLRIINNKNKPDFPFFLSTDLFPEWAFASMKSVPKELQDKVKEILLSIHADTQAAKTGKYVGWVESKNYSAVKALMKSLKVGPYAP